MNLGAHADVAATAVVMAGRFAKDVSGGGRRDG